jgi:hypothetical protein
MGKWERRKVEDNSVWVVAHETDNSFLQRPTAFFNMMQDRWIMYLNDTKKMR